MTAGMPHSRISKPVTNSTRRRINACICGEQEKTMKTTNLLLAGAACIAVALTSAQAQDNKPTFGAWGIDLAGMDKSVKPGDDFFDYANGTWYKNAAIPAD